MKIFSSSHYLKMKGKRESWHLTIWTLKQFLALISAVMLNNLLLDRMRTIQQKDSKQYFQVCQHKSVLMTLLDNLQSLILTL